jgi:uncharacterized membrane protein
MTRKKGLLGTNFWRIRALIILFVDIILIVALVLMLQIDTLVNTTLYNYGLTFNAAWAGPYWAMLRSSLVLIVVAIIMISMLELAFASFESEKGQVEEQE